MEGQNLPERNLFNFIFESDFEDDPLGRYTDALLRDDWNNGGTLSATEVFDIISENDTYYNKFLRGYLEGGKYLPANHGWYWTSSLSTHYKELYISYDIRFKPGFEWVIGGKMPFGMSGGPISSGALPTINSGWTVRTMWKENGRLVFYVYHQDQTIQFGSSYGWGNFSFTSGKWYNITMRVVLNTFKDGVAANNGILEGFIDGKLLFQKRDFQFRAVESIEIDNLIMSAFFGGGTAEWAATRDEWIDMDNFVAFTYSNKIINVPIGNQTSSASKDLIHPYRTYSDAEWKKSLKSSSVTLSDITLNWIDYPVPKIYTLERKESESATFTTVATLGYGAKTYTDKSLQPGKSYIYRLKAGSSFTNQLTVNTKSPVLPNMPSSLAASGITKSGLTLTWDDNSSNETGFKIERSLASSTGFSEIASTLANVTIYQDNSLQPSTTYYYRIKAFNADGSSDYTTDISVTTIALQIPSPPSGLIASQIDYTWATVFWTDNANNENGFELERSGPGDLSIKSIILLSANTSNYIDRELVMDGVYRYRIRSINSDGNSGWSNVIEVVTPKILPPVAPTRLKSTKYTEKSISVCWDDNSDNEDSFIITRSLAADSSSAVNIAVNANDTSFTDTSLVGSTTYQYTIIARNLAGTSSTSNKNVATTLSKAELKRVKDGLVAYYNFGYNPDYIIYDQSGFNDPVNLRVLDRAAIKWNEDNTLDLLANTALVSMIPATKIIQALKSTNEVTFECWLKARNPESGFNSRIISLGNSDDDIGFLLDQNLEGDLEYQTLNYSIRMQTASTVPSGYPAFIPDRSQSFITMQHLVYTRDRFGNETLYVNGSLHQMGSVQAILYPGKITTI